MSMSHGRKFRKNLLRLMDENSWLRHWDVPIHQDKTVCYKKAFLSPKMQFFKSFILPYFDYCISLLIYVPQKMSLTRLCKLYYLCLFRLFKLQFIGKSEIEISNEFKQHGLMTIQRRIFYRIMLFLHENFNNSSQELPIGASQSVSLAQVEWKSGNYNIARSQ